MVKTSKSEWFDILTSRPYGCPVPLEELDPNPQVNHTASSLSAPEITTKFETNMNHEKIYHYPKFYWLLFIVIQLSVIDSNSPQSPRYQINLLSTNIAIEAMAQSK
jgi:hypothetical protein